MKRREPKPPKFVWECEYVKGGYIELSLPTCGMRALLSPKELDALCRWWLRWRAWEKENKR